MATTDQEIASAAARRSAGMRRRVSNTCPVCGETFEGLTTRKYCSGRCRTEAGRRQLVVDEHTFTDPPVGRLLTDEELERRPDEDVVEYLARTWRSMFGDRVFTTDVVEDLRREDELLSEHVYKLSRGG